MKVTDLPIYTSCCKNKQIEKIEQANVIEPYVSDVRKQFDEFVGPQFGQSIKRMGEIISTSKAHTYELIETVRDDQNAAARATFITSAAFIGYLLGRRGFFRRTFMAILMAGSAAAICEPKLARDYAEVTLELIKERTSDLYKEFGGPDLMESIQQMKLFNNEDSKPKSN